ncbi:LolA-like protein [Ferruginibacter sp.]
MKPLFIFCLFIMVMIFAQFAQAQTVDEIIDKNITAMGGKEKLASLKSVKMEGNLSVMGNDVALAITTSHGVGMRADISVMGTENYQIVTPAKGTVFMPVQGMSEPTPMSDDQLKSATGQLDLQGALFNYKEKGSTVTLVGKETVDGEECYNIKLTNKMGTVTNYFISTKTNFKIKSTGKRMVNGEETEVANTYSNYKQNADGYWFPYSTTNAQGTTDFSKIDTNIAVDESIFKQ